MKLNKVAFSFGILLIASTCFAQMYTITDLGTLGGSYSVAYGINASGQVTGCSGGTVFLYSNGTMKELGGRQESCGLGINASGQVAGLAAVYTNDGKRTNHAFVFSEGSARDLGTLGGSNSLAYGINASGTAIGTADTIDPYVQHAFLYHDGPMFDFNQPDDFAGAGMAINDSGQFTGWVYTAEYRAFAFLYTSGEMIDIGRLGYGGTAPYGINAAGHVTGNSESKSGSGHAFLYRDGVMTDLGACANLPDESVGYGINSLDQVTGVCYTNGADQTAFLYTPGQGMVDLNTLIPSDSGWKLTDGRGINDAGQIAGTGKNPSGQYHAFLLSPVGTKSSTATTLATSLNPSIYGQKVTFTARVTTSGPVPPTGTVIFKWKYFTTTYTIGTATLNSAGLATLTKSNLNANPFPMIAVYRGDTNNLSSTSAVLNQTVLQTTSTAALASSVNPSRAGQAITFTTKITSPTVIPSGPVTFKAGTTVLGSAQLSSGNAIFTTSTLPAGSTVVRVIYNGNSNIKGSSASLTQTVQP